MSFVDIPVQFEESTLCCSIPSTGSSSRVHLHHYVGRICICDGQAQRYLNSSSSTACHIERMFVLSFQVSYHCVRRSCGKVYLITSTNNFSPYAIVSTCKTKLHPCSTPHWNTMYNTFGGLNHVVAELDT